MNKYYLIAGLSIGIEGENLIRAVERIYGFEFFSIDNKEETLFQFVETEKESPDFVSEHYSSDVDGVYKTFGIYNEGYLFKMFPQNEESLSVWMKKDSNIAYFKGNFDVALLRFACWIAFGVLSAKYETVAVHTSCIVKDGKAVLFLGESGTGKSTHTRLWVNNIKDAMLLNDDSPILRIIDGIPTVFGSPWSGKTHCYKNESYPLVACVRLSQAPYNEMKELNVLNAYASLHPSCPPFFAYDDSIYGFICEVLDVVISSFPVYHLACLPNAEAAFLSYSTIFDNEK